MLKLDLGFIEKHQVLMGCLWNMWSVQQGDAQPGWSDQTFVRQNLSIKKEDQK